MADARVYEGCGADVIVAENFGDVPITHGAVPAETIATVAVAAVRAAVKLRLGFNVQRNAAAAALAFCAACGGAFIHVNVHAGAMVTDLGLVEGDAFEIVRL